MKIYSINNFFTDNILSSIDAEIKEAKWGYGWHSNKSIGYPHWNHNFVDCISENSLDISDKLPESMQKVWGYISTVHFPNNRLLRCYTNSHTYGIEGYPHIDSTRPQDRTIVVYMNKTWLREWGGETVIFEDNDIVHAELPKRNKALVFPGNQYHVSRGVTRICPELRITVMFKIAPNSETDTDRDNVQRFLYSINAHKFPHNEGKLIGHLLRTYDLLKNAQQKPEVCLAGAVHSVFGTNAYKLQAVPSSDRQKVVDAVGEKATLLAEKFSTINRPKILEQNVGNIEYIDLCTIECANLLDQKILNKYPELSAYWQQLNITNRLV